MLIDKIKRAKEQLAQLPCLPQQAENVEFIYRSSDFKQQIIQLIRQAKKRIYITALYWEKDEAGQEIINEIYLAKEKNPALDVKILVDWHRAQRNLIGADKTKSKTNADWYHEEKTKQEIIENIFFGVPINTREVFGVLHIKGFVFDDTLLYSGASINNIYLQQNERYRYDRYQKITNPQLADSFVAFIQKYLLSSLAVNPLDNISRPQNREIKPDVRAFRRMLGLEGEYLLTEATSMGDDLTICPLFGLGRNKNILNTTIESLFQVVENKLIICTPYFNLPRSLKKKVLYLLKKDKRVEIIVGDKTANDFYIPPSEPFKMIGALPYLYESNLYHFSKKFDRYIQNGQLIIRTWKNKENSYHLKGVWVDQDYALLTGNNLNPRAWLLDAENGLLLHDPKHQLLPQLEKELDHIREHTKILQHYTELDDPKDYPEQVQRLLKKFSRTKLDKIVKMIL